jgi:hypothetical protein
LLLLRRLLSFDQFHAHNLYAQVSSDARREILGRLPNYLNSVQQSQN